jgi:hypothetical protein
VQESTGHHQSPEDRKKGRENDDGGLVERHVFINTFAPTKRYGKYGGRAYAGGFFIDRNGEIRYQHFGESMNIIPENQQILSLLDELNK